MKDAEAAAIGSRAAQVMDERGVSPKKECAALGLGKNMYYSWRDGICAPPPGRYALWPFGAMMSCIF